MGLPGGAVVARVRSPRQGEETVSLASSWYVYIILTRSGRLYTGITTDVARRFAEHAGQGKRPGAKFFRSDPPVRVLWSERQPDRSAASRREAAIKRMTRQQKLAIIGPFDAGQGKDSRIAR